MDQALRLSYSYGLTYPLIDDLLDSDILSKDEQKRYSNMIRTALITGVVPELGEWTGENGILSGLPMANCVKLLIILKHSNLSSIGEILHEAYVFSNPKKKTG